MPNQVNKIVDKLRRTRDRLELVTDELREERAEDLMHPRETRATSASLTSHVKRTGLMTIQATDVYGLADERYVDLKELLTNDDGSYWGIGVTKPPEDETHIPPRVVFEASKYDIRRYKERDWNHEFQTEIGHTMTRNWVKKFSALRCISEMQDHFVEVAINLTKVVVSELHVPYQYKSLKPTALPKRRKTVSEFDANDVLKQHTYKADEWEPVYVFNNMMLQIAMYQAPFFEGEDPAMKALSNELKAQRFIQRDAMEQGLHFPMSVTIDYAGMGPAHIPPQLVHCSTAAIHTCCLRCPKQQACIKMRPQSRRGPKVAHQTLGKMHFLTQILSLRLAGHRILATALLPAIADQKDLVDVNKRQKELNEKEDITEQDWDNFQQQIKTKVARLAHSLNLKKHSLSFDEASEEIDMTADLQMFVGTDRRNYVMGVMRCLPPEPPVYPLQGPVEHLYKLMRPEVLLQSVKPLNADSFTAFSGTNWKEDNEQVRNAFNTLKRNVLPNLSKFLDDHADDNPDLQWHIAHQMHRHGINIRFMGMVGRHCKSKRIVGMCCSEMVARCLKVELRKRWRVRLRYMMQSHSCANLPLYRCMYIHICLSSISLFLSLCVRHSISPLALTDFASSCDSLLPSLTHRLLQVG